MTTAETLEQRIDALEREVTRLKMSLRAEVSSSQPGVESRGARLIREAEENRTAVAAGWTKLKADLGIHGQPVGAVKLREMLQAQGINPDDNSFSRELIAMREE